MRSPTSDNPQGAAESYLKVLEHEDGDAATYYNLGLAYDETERLPARPSSTSRRAVSDDAEYADAWYGMGCALDAQGFYDDALASFGRAHRARA